MPKVCFFIRLLIYFYSKYIMPLYWPCNLSFTVLQNFLCITCKTRVQFKRVVFFCCMSPSRINSSYCFLRLQYTHEIREKRKTQTCTKNILDLKNSPRLRSSKFSHTQNYLFLVVVLSLLSTKFHTCCFLHYSYFL